MALLLLAMLVWQPLPGFIYDSPNIINLPLLSRLHRGYLWLDQKYLVYMDTMHMVSGLPHIGEDPVVAISLRDATINEVYRRYDTYRVMRKVVIMAFRD